MLKSVQLLNCFVCLFVCLQFFDLQVMVFLFLLLCFLGDSGETNRRDSCKYMLEASCFGEEGKASKGTGPQLSEVQFN
jgi:hypothetical protein